MRVNLVKEGRIVRCLSMESMSDVQRAVIERGSTISGGRITSMRTERSSPSGSVADAMLRNRLLDVLWN